MAADVRPLVRLSLQVIAEQNGETILQLSASFHNAERGYVHEEPAAPNEAPDAAQSGEAAPAESSGG